MSNRKYIYYDYLMKINNFNDEELENSLEELYNNHYNSFNGEKIKNESKDEFIKIIKNINENKKEYIKEFKNNNREENKKNINVENNNNKNESKSIKRKGAEMEELIEQLHKKEYEISNLKGELTSQRKEIEKYNNSLKLINELQEKNKELNKKIGQLTEELRLAHLKIKNSNKNNSPAINSKNENFNKVNEKRTLNLDDISNIKHNHIFNKLFNEDEKKALLTLFKSDEELYNFNNKICILDDRAKQLENELKEQNKSLIKKLNDKEDQIKSLHKKIKENNDNNVYINKLKEKDNIIASLKKDINELKIKKNLNLNKFHSLSIRKQYYIYYIEEKLYIDSNINDYDEFVGPNQKRLLKLISEDEKRKVIKIKKIKSNDC